MILQMGWANLPRDEWLAKNVRCISRTETKERQSMGDSHHTSSKTDVFGAYPHERMLQESFTIDEGSRHYC